MTDDIEEEETEPRYQRLEVTVGVMVPFEWDAEAETYRLVLNEVTTTTGGLFSDAEEGVWVPEVEDWVTPEDADQDSAFTAAWRFVTELVVTDLVR